MERSTRKNPPGINMRTIDRKDGDAIMTVGALNVIHVMTWRCDNDSGRSECDTCNDMN